MGNRDVESTLDALPALAHPRPLPAPGALMLNVDLLKRRLAQYGTTWVAGFFLVLLGALGLTYGLHMSLAKACDTMLSVAFVGLAVVLVAFAIATLVSRQSLLTNLVLVPVALILLIPLLWAPVLGAIVTAWIGHAEIEYSNVYAQFRSILGQVLYAVTKLIFGNPLVDAAMAFFQGLATVVGFIASITQLWLTFGRRRAAEED